MWSLEHNEIFFVKTKWKVVFKKEKYFNASNLGHEYQFHVLNQLTYT